MSQFTPNPGSFPGNILNQVLNSNPAGSVGQIDPSLNPSTILGGINPFPSVTPGGGFDLGAIGSVIVKGAEDVLAELDKKINATVREDTTLYPVVIGVAHITFEDDQTLDRAFPILEMVCDINGHKEADILELTWNYNDLPADPRRVKSMICSLWVGYQESLQSPTTAQQALATFQAGKMQQMFEGYADEYHIEWKNDGYEAKAKSRDYTSLLIDTKIQEGDFKVIRGTDKFTDIVKKLAEPFKFVVKFSQGLEAKCPTVQQYFGDKDHRLVEEHTTYWDVICKMAEMIGCIAFVWQRTLYFGAPDPFKVFETVHGEKATHIEYMWGTNIQELEIRRKYNTNYRYTNVEVRGFDIKKGKPIYVTWPDPPAQRDVRMVGGSFQSSVIQGKAGQGPLPQYKTAEQQRNHQVPVFDKKTGKPVMMTNGKQQTKTVNDIPRTVVTATDGKGGGKYESGKENEKVVQENYIVYAPHNCRDEKILKEIAKQTWNNLHRMEIEGRMKVQGHSDMVAAMAFQISMSPEHIKLLHTYPSIPDRVKALIKRGYHPTLAQQMATQIEEDEGRWWYALGAKHKYADGSGYECEVDFISFVNFDAAKKGENTPQQSASKPGGKGSGKAATPTNPTKPSRRNNQSPTISVQGNLPAAIGQQILNSAINTQPSNQGVNFGPLVGP
jgi:hypothetical protein